MVTYRLNELALMELENERKGIKEQEMMTYSVRLPVEVNQHLEIIAEKLQLKKSDVTRDLLASATKEALIALKVDPLDWDSLEEGESNE